MLSVAILIPCHNEERSIAACIRSCLNQTRKPDEIVVVDDASTDSTPLILKRFKNNINVITLPKNTGNKSYVQEIGLNFISTDIFISTDADTLLDREFVGRAVKAFEDPAVSAFAGYVKSLKFNWLTACREIDYCVGQTIHKKAQSVINALLVIPGCAGAFRTKIFRRVITFDHDTVTEDLDFTYKFHEKNLKIVYDQEAIVYTQDPGTLRSYTKQMRRWMGGGWQNLVKHFSLIKKPPNTLELLLIYAEGLVFSVLILITPIISLYFTVFILLSHIAISILLAILSSLKDRRIDLLLYSPLYAFISYLNAYIFVEQFIAQVVLKKQTLTWYQPDRRVVV